MAEDESRRLYAELKQLGVKIDNLTDLFNRASYGEGFPRCATHANRIAHMEEGVELCHARISGVKRWLIAGLVSLVSLLANVVWNIVNAAMRN